MKILALILALPISALAGPYLVVGGGSAQHAENGNGVWFQNGFEHKISSGSSAYQIGAGWRVNKWLSVEALYHDFGNTSISADFVFPDANYREESLNHCEGPCNPVAHGEGRGRTTGFSLSLLPTYEISRNWSVFGRLGALFYRKTWEEVVTCCAPGTYSEGALYGPELSARFSNLHPLGEGRYKWYGEDSVVKPENSGVATLLGMGVQYKSLRAEYLETRGVSALGDGFTNLRSVTLSYVVKF